MLCFVQMMENEIKEPCAIISFFHFFETFQEGSNHCSKALIKNHFHYSITLCIISLLYFIFFIMTRMKKVMVSTICRIMDDHSQSGVHSGLG